MDEKRGISFETSDEEGPRIGVEMIEFLSAEEWVFLGFQLLVNGGTTRSRSDPNRLTLLSLKLAGE
jgi:hypothetical protein